MATIGSLSVGSSVYLNVNGAKTEFLIVQQGSPDATEYSGTADGTWLLTKDIYTTMAWNSKYAAYTSSSLNTYLNGTFLNMIDADIANHIVGYKISASVTLKVFLLSVAEVGYTKNSSYTDGRGVKLSYFNGCSTSGDDDKRVAYLAGGTEPFYDGWWLRDRHTSGSGVWRCTSTGACNAIEPTRSAGVRPAMVLDSDLYYDPATGYVTVTPPDPMAPTDGHNTNIGAVAYQLESGTARFGGAAYEIESGMTRVNGVAWEIPFGNKIVTVTISGTTNDLYAYATIGGSQITATGTTEYEAPLEITVYVSSARNSTNCKITQNGTTVKSGAGSYTFTTEAETVKIAFTKTGSSFSAYYTAAITEE